MHRRRLTTIAALAITLLAALALAACQPKEIADQGHMLVFDYEGKFIPVEQLHLAPADACDGEHWHGGPATTLRKESLSEPDSPCGFGTTDDLDVIEVPMPDDYQGVQLTDAEWRFDP